VCYGSSFERCVMGPHLKGVLGVLC